MADGSYITERELTAHLARVYDKLEAMQGDLNEIKTSVQAAPRWLGKRATTIVDKVLPTLLIAAALYVLGSRLGVGG